MYSTDLIRRLPKEPTLPILYVVYNDAMIEGAQFLIAEIHGFAYLSNVTVVSSLGDGSKNKLNYETYIDPLVYTYKHSWND